ncbi:MAG: type IV secretion system DNA-binding domain-containing protein [bacterium]|nr:type IV secretion system DNA-binding domain-containing protein [bacterium]
MEDQDKITYFAQTDSRNRRIPFGIKAKDRSRHMYVIGKTGMGKSTLLENMAIQDIQNGNGVAFLDPHGKSADMLLEYVPEDRIRDVLYFAPFDMKFPVSFNVLEDVGADKRHLVANGLMSTFEKIWVDAWSARMAYILNNTILALLEYPEATLLGINRMLSDKEYRKKIVDNVRDPSVRSFWVDEFAKYTDRFAAEATPAIQNKVGQFTSNPLIRNIIGQPKSSFDLRKIMDEKKIVIINLSKGLVGEGNAKLLGSMLITKIYLSAMSRADVTETVVAKLPNFYLYVDEFQSFANKSFADILSEARKYKLNLSIAHQYIEQMEEEVRAAVFGNVGTMITFRVGAYDAEVLEKEFAPQFTAEDLVNLGFAQIYLKLMIDGVSSAPFSAVTEPPIDKPAVNYKQEIIENSRNIFGKPRLDVETFIDEWHNPSSKNRMAQGNESKPMPSYMARNEKVPSNSNQKSDDSRSFTPKSSENQKYPFAEAFKNIKNDTEQRPLYSAIQSPKSVSGEPVKKESVPLSSLKNRDFPIKKSSVNGGQHLEDLRAALSEVIKNKDKPEKTETSPNISEGNLEKKEYDKSNTKNPSGSKVFSSQATAPEVPEKILRDMFRVEKPK